MSKRLLAVFAVFGAVVSSPLAVVAAVCYHQTTNNTCGVAHHPGDDDCSDIVNHQHGNQLGASDKKGSSVPNGWCAKTYSSQVPCGFIGSQVDPGCPIKE